MTHIAAQTKTYLIAFGIIVSVGIFYVATIREGYYWRSDSSLYIAHAKNIAEGRPYQATGFIYNPNYPSYSPRMYPPAFPILLSPVYKLFGINIKVMKIEITFIFMLALGCIYATFQDKLPANYLLALVATVGFSPFFWVLKDEILSDIPFLLFCYMAIFFIDRFDPQYSTKIAIRPPTILQIIAIGVSLYAAYASRTVGAILVLCFILYVAVKRTYSIRVVVLSLSICAFLIVLQNVFIGKDGSYLEQFKLSDMVALVYDNSAFYIQELLKIWSNNHNKNIAIVLFIWISTCAIIGYTYRVRYKNSFLEIFVPCYIFVILFWPSNQDRFLTPLIPVYVFFAFKGIEVSVTRLTKLLHHSVISKGIRYGVISITVFAICITYIGVYTTAEYQPIPGINTSKSQELFTYIRKNTNVSDIVLCRDPRTLALFTGRNASVYARTQIDEDSWAYIKMINVMYIVVGGFGKEERFQADQEYLYPFVQAYRRNFDRVFDNGSFKVYKIRSYTHE